MTPAQRAFIELRRALMNFFAEFTTLIVQGLKPKPRLEEMHREPSGGLDRRQYATVVSINHPVLRKIEPDHVAIKQGPAPAPREILDGATTDRWPRFPVRAPRTSSRTCAELRLFLRHVYLAACAGQRGQNLGAISALRSQSRAAAIGNT